MDESSAGVSLGSPGSLPRGNVEAARRGAGLPQRRAGGDGLGRQGGAAEDGYHTYKGAEEAPLELAPKSIDDLFHQMLDMKASVAMVDWINDNPDDHLITIEDPVEFVHRDKKCLLREDPDIVLAGEAQVRTMFSESLKGVVAQTLLKKKGGGPSAMQVGRGLGMQTINDAVIELVKSGTVEPQEAYDRAIVKKEMALLLTRSGFKGPWSEEKV